MHWILLYKIMKFGKLISCCYGASSDINLRLSTQSRHQSSVCKRYGRFLFRQHSMFVSPLNRYLQQQVNIYFSFKYVSPFAGGMGIFRAHNYEQSAKCRSLLPGRAAVEFSNNVALSLKLGNSSIDTKNVSGGQAGRKM